MTKNPRLSIKISEMTLARIAATLIAASAAGCAGAPNSAEPVTATEGRLDFSNADDFMSWLGERAEGQDGVKVGYDAAGAVRAVNFESPAAREQFLTDIEGEGQIYVAGERFSWPSSDADGSPDSETSAASDAQGVGSLSQALTSGIPESVFTQTGSGAFALQGISHNHHISIAGIGWHQVGGTTKIWKGGTASCNIFDFAGLKTCLQRNQNVHVSVANTYFSNSSSCGSGHCSNTPVAVANDRGDATGSNEVTQEMEALGYLTIGCSNGFGAAECRVDGVCSAHWAYSLNGEYLATQTTASGSYNCQ